MSIIGCKVWHENFGEGMIDNYEDGVISVEFILKTGDKKISRFLFPEAFVNNFLVPIDDKSRQNIKLMMDELKCSFCGKMNLHTESIDGKRICSECKKANTFICSMCNNVHHKTNKVQIRVSDDSYQKTTICVDCAETKSFECDSCGSRFTNIYRATNTVNNKIWCKKCYRQSVELCSFCGEPYISEEGENFYRYSGDINVCPSCIPNNTFKCESCGGICLMESLVNSKFVPKSKFICDSCVSTCSVCGEAINEGDINEAFNKYYCPDCWRNMVKCSICGDEFVPESNNQVLCPDCIDMEAYVARIENKDFINCKYREMSCYRLEYMDRCRLFTRLYESCKELEGRVFGDRNDEPFHLLVMRLLGYRVVITYLPQNIVGNVKYSRNLTLTKFRSSDGRLSVHNAISKWDDLSSHYVQTVAGKMKILNYPVLIRVQTEYDKVYGKNWNGPYDYIEIGNYGDTTDFYIIGLL